VLLKGHEREGAWTVASYGLIVLVEIACVPVNNAKEYGTKTRKCKNKIKKRILVGVN
jgi:hypothetical protein